MSTTQDTLKISKYEKTKKKIVDVFLALISDKEWDKITVKEICAKADITRGTFYLYFNDIYDLMEQQQTILLDDLKDRYDKLPKTPYAAFPPELFDQKFDCAPPAMLITWFDFCKDHKKAMLALLNRKHGDTYFVIKLRNLISDNINYMMDHDGLPQDSLRTHFVKIFLELHFLSALTWLEQGDDHFLSVSEIVNLLNTMRVGANYLSNRQHRFSDSTFNTSAE